MSWTSKANTLPISENFPLTTTCTTQIPVLTNVESEHILTRLQNPDFSILPKLYFLQDNDYFRHMSFSISYPDLIKFPCFADLTPKEDRGWKEAQREGERHGDFMTFPVFWNLIPYERVSVRLFLTSEITLLYQIEMCFYCAHLNCVCDHLSSIALWARVNHHPPPPHTAWMACGHKTLFHCIVVPYLIRVVNHMY
jgi:hypothetical protein